MSCLDSTTAELERLGALETPEGQAALMLADAIDSGKSLMALPAMVKELAAQLKTIRDSVPDQGDAVDDVLARRRAAKADGSADASGVVRTTQRKRREGR